MKLIKRSYESGYHDNPLYRETENSQRNQARLALLRARRSDGRLLEIGCGSGGFLRLAEAYYPVEGVDVSRAAVAQLREQFGKRVSQFNVEQRPLPQASYEIIVAFNILEHLRQPHRAVEKICQALTPGGLLLGSVPNNYGLVGGANTRLGNFFDRTHVSTFTPDTWERIFRHAGFGKVEFFGEVTLGRNRCRYLTGPLWPHLSFNLMFLCEK